jgi:dihydroxyacid dehydratase/phosphogluconate dehydratase
MINGFDFTNLTPVQAVVAFMALGFSTGFLLHWVAKAGTAARWALNSAS